MTFDDKSCYMRGVLIKKDDRDQDGKPIKIRKWFNFYSELIGYTLWFWTVTEVFEKKINTILAKKNKGTNFVHPNELREIIALVKQSDQTPIKIDISSSVFRALGALKKRMHVFELLPNGESRHYLQANSEESMQKWVDAITFSCQNYASNCVSQTQNLLFGKYPYFLNDKVSTDCFQVKVKIEKSTLWLECNLSLSFEKSKNKWLITLNELLPKNTKKEDKPLMNISLVNKAYAVIPTESRKDKVSDLVLARIEGVIEHSFVKKRKANSVIINTIDIQFKSEREMINLISIASKIYYLQGLSKNPSGGYNINNGMQSFNGVNPLMQSPGMPDNGNMLFEQNSNSNIGNNENLDGSNLSKTVNMAKNEEVQLNENGKSNTDNNLPEIKTLKQKKSFLSRTLRIGSLFGRKKNKDTAIPTYNPELNVKPTEEKIDNNTVNETNIVEDGNKISENKEDGYDVNTLNKVLPQFEEDTMDAQKMIEKSVENILQTRNNIQKLYQQEQNIQMEDAQNKVKQTVLGNINENNGQTNINNTNHQYSFGGMVGQENNNPSMNNGVVNKKDNGNVYTDSDSEVDVPLSAVYKVQQNINSQSGNANGPNVYEINGENNSYNSPVVGYQNNRDNGMNAQNNLQKQNIPGDINTNQSLNGNGIIDDYGNAIIPSLVASSALAMQNGMNNPQNISNEPHYLHNNNYAASPQVYNGHNNIQPEEMIQGSSEQYNYHKQGYVENVRAGMVQNGQVYPMGYGMHTQDNGNTYGTFQDGGYGGGTMLAHGGMAQDYSSYYQQETNTAPLLAVKENPKVEEKSIGIIGTIATLEQIKKDQRYRDSTSLIRGRQIKKNLDAGGYGHVGYGDSNGNVSSWVNSCEPSPHSFTQKLRNSNSMIFGENGKMLNPAENSSGLRPRTIYMSKSSSNLYGSGNNRGNILSHYGNIGSLRGNNNDIDDNLPLSTPNRVASMYFGGSPAISQTSIPNSSVGYSMNHDGVPGVRYISSAMGGYNGGTHVRSSVAHYGGGLGFDHRSNNGMNHEDYGSGSHLGTARNTMYSTSKPQQHMSVLVDPQQAMLLRRSQKFDGIERGVSSESLRSRVISGVEYSNSSNNLSAYGDKGLVNQGKGEMGHEEGGSGMKGGNKFNDSRTYVANQETKKKSNGTLVGGVQKEEKEVSKEKKLEFEYDQSVSYAVAAYFEQFLEKCVESKPYSQVGCHDLYQTYSNYCTRNGSKEGKVTYDNFIKMLHSTDWTIKPSHSGGYDICNAVVV
ncbi:hypothetical protein BB558_002473 [Smittium angustum]|uniref:PH domain-containing protein n=1 Tax=Smittium angustum TaxID=133377 RepID=A0A2U1J2T1_SMIAN|nr:hypothetical protein BB558_004644 [Smittium angustum]PWA01424.1 hypothetical protein BB558_002473 [Smittium angustum]